MKAKTSLFLTGLAALAALLAACGGGSDASNTAPQDASTVPDSAMASGASMTRFVALQAVRDDSEPLPLSSVTPPESNDSEPQALSY